MIFKSIKINNKIKLNHQKKKKCEKEFFFLFYLFEENFLNESLWRKKSRGNE